MYVVCGTPPKTSLFNGHTTPGISMYPPCFRLYTNKSIFIVIEYFMDALNKIRNEMKVCNYFFIFFFLLCLSKSNSRQEPPSQLLYVCRHAVYRGSINILT